jgi:hypothetical protein
MNAIPAEDLRGAPSLDARLFASVRRGWIPLAAGSIPKSTASTRIDRFARSILRIAVDFATIRPPRHLPRQPAILEPSATTRHLPTGPTRTARGPTVTYDLFISYAHADDAQGWVTRLHEALVVLGATLVDQREGSERRWG